MQVQTFIYTLRSGEYWCEDGDTQMDAHIERMIAGGWEVLNSASDTGHVRIGKTLAVGAMTGGLSLLFGGSRTAKTIPLTFKTDKPAPEPDPEASSDTSTGYIVLFGIIAVVVLMALATR